MLGGEMSSYSLAGSKLVKNENGISTELTLEQIQVAIESGDLAEFITRVSTLKTEATIVACLSNSNVELSLAVKTPLGNRVNLEGNMHGVVSNSVWFPLPKNELEYLKSEITQRFHGVTSINLLELKKLLDSDVGPFVLVEHAALPNREDENLPSAIHGELFPYQQEGLVYLRSMAATSPGALLADEMGLGKTLQVIALIAERAKNNNEVALVVMPSSLLGNWQREFAKFAPNVRVLRHSGNARSFEPNQFDNWDVVLTSYHLVANDIALLGDFKWGLLVLDEAQYIKNPDADRSHHVKSLRRTFSLAVTGTPFETNIRDFWSIIDFISPGYLGDYPNFERTFSQDHDSVELLRDATKNLFIRRLVRDVSTELPDRFEIPEWLPLSEQMEFEQNEILHSNSNALIKMNALVLLSQHGGEKASLESLENSLKLARLGEILSEIFQNGEKAVVFANYDFAITGIFNYLRSRFPRAFVETITGKVAPDTRLDLIDKLGESEIGVLIINPQAGGVGLNIVHANHVIHFSPLWNPALREQATKRSHRTGQDKPVFVRHLLYEYSVEEVMWQRQAERIEINEILMDHNAPKYEDILEQIRKINAR
jgi:SNF2 family DNA or RNA helicase